MRNFALILTSLAMALVLVSCGVSDEQQSKVLADGLTILDVSETKISLAFKDSGQVIFMEALRGNKTPDMYQQDPEAPVWEVDARFKAENGRLFYTARGGDQWVDSSWTRDLIEDEEKYTSRESNELLFILSGKAVASLDEHIKTELGEEMAKTIEPLLRPIKNFGERAHERYLEQRVRLHKHLVDLGLMADDPLLTSENGEILYGSGGTGCDDWVNLTSNYYYMAVHDKSTAVIARHSATRLYEWQGYWNKIHDNCNHGTCANDMGQKCLLQYHEAIVDYKPAWELQSCGTDYDAFSNDGHNCHDDTRVQLANFVYGNGHNRGPGSNFWCDDDDDSDISSWPGDQSGSPECSSSTDDGYRHDHMCRTQGLHSYNSAGGCYCDESCLDFNDCCIDGPY